MRISHFYERISIMFTQRTVNKKNTKNKDSHLLVKIGELREGES